MVFQQKERSWFHSVVKRRYFFIVSVINVELEDGSNNNTEAVEKCPTDRGNT